MRSASFIARSAAVGSVALVAQLCLSSALAAGGGTFDAPSKGKVGQSFTVVGKGVKPGHVYRLVFDQLQGDKKQGIECARDLDRPYKVTGTSQTLKFTARIPKTLTCSRSSGGRLKQTVTVRSGHAYLWVLASKSGRASYDHDASIVVKKITVS